MTATNENSSRGRGGERLNSRLRLPSIGPSQDQVNRTPRKRASISHHHSSTYVDYDGTFDVAEYFEEYFRTFRPNEDRSLNKNLKWRSSFPSDLKNSLGDLLPVVMDGTRHRIDRRAITDNAVACCCLHYALPKLWADDGIRRIKEAHDQIRRGRSTSRDEGLVDFITEIMSRFPFSLPSGGYSTTGASLHVPQTIYNMIYGLANGLGMKLCDVAALSFMLAISRSSAGVSSKKQANFSEGVSFFLSRVACMADMVEAGLKGAL